MFRSGVPPHIGQSPMPGSDACTKHTTDAATKKVMITTFILAPGSWRFFTGPWPLTPGPFLLVRFHLQIIQVHPELRVNKQSRRALVIPDRIDLLDRPRRRLRFSGRPRLPARPN